MKAPTLTEQSVSQTPGANPSSPGGLSADEQTASLPYP
jgi:hypothetical protein